MCKKINIFMPLLFLFYLAGSIAVSSIIRSTGVEMPLWIQTVVSQGIILFPAIVYVLVMKINIVKSIPYRKISFKTAVLSLLFGYALIPFITLTSLISVLFVKNHLNSEVSAITSYPFIIQIILMAVIPPLVEEFIFRGLFYHSYRKNGILGAAVMSSVVFGCIHMNINQFLYTVSAGIVFALLVEATGSIWSSVIAHFAVNTYSIIQLKMLSWLSSGKTGITTAMTQQMTLSLSVIMVQIGYYAVLSIIFLWVAYIIYKKIAKDNNRLEYMQYNLSLGFKAQNGERFITSPALATIIVSIIMMICFEM